MLFFQKFLIVALSEFLKCLLVAMQLSKFNILQYEVQPMNNLVVSPSLLKKILNILWSLILEINLNALNTIILLYFQQLSENKGE